MKFFRTLILALGALAFFAGIGIFVYFIFIRAPDIEDGGTLIGTHTFAEMDDSGTIELSNLESASSIQPRISFDYYSYGFIAGPVQVISTRANYRVWVRIILEGKNGAVLRSEDIPIEAVDTWKSGEAEGKGEFRGRPIALGSSIASSPGSEPPARLRIALLPNESDPHKTSGELRMNSGGFQNVVISAYRDARDVRAYNELNAEAPTWGLWTSGVGILLLIFGAVLPSSRKPPLS